MPTRLPNRPESEPGRFRQFMAGTPPWFQWLTLTAMFLAGLAIVILYLWSVKTPPLEPIYAW